MTIVTRAADPAHPASTVDAMRAAAIAQSTVVRCLNVGGISCPPVVLLQTTGVFAFLLQDQCYAG